MNIYKLEDIKELTASGSVVTVGMFDGVHVGHRHILSLLGRVAAEKGLRPVVVTFDRHPRQVLTEGVATHFRITTNEERSRLLSQCGVDTVVELPFTPQLAGMSACEFFEQVLVGQMNARALVLGFDNMFGSRGRNDFDRLPALAEEKGVSIHVDKAVFYHGSEVSSTRIRKALEHGQTDRAASMLGRGYVMWGTVEKGRQLGRLLGFPTANVSLADTSKVWPADGVYAVWVTLSDGTAGLKGMANFGAQPTFGLDKPVFEVNIFDFEGDLYDSVLTVEFGPRLRDICRFESVPVLVEQLNADRAAARKLLSRSKGGNKK
ncbi:MAG: riboflavin biosynthesis protein RibF [Bacteroidales bacterium]|nr:riboflavin biosynthesis protein RibF [Bacteroidales bacterium]